MENMLLVGLSRQTALRRELDVVANNIANVNTNGFKADANVFAEHVMPGVREGGFDRRAPLSFVQDHATWHDLRGGGIQQTGNPLDVAVNGDAFLVVETPAGERYTRNGAFQINAAGELVNASGHRVLGDAGPIVFQPQDRDVAIGADGTITVNGNAQRGKLRAVRFAQPNALRKDGALNFRVAGNIQPEPVAAPNFTQGAIEKSNVQSVLEMTRMIEISRSYQNISSMLQNQADMRRSAIERLADVPA